jgi:hypothetical protein
MDEFSGDILVARDTSYIQSGAGEGDKHLVVALPTAHPGKSIINNAAPEELLHHFIDYRTPGPKITAVTAEINPFEFVKVFVHELIEGGVGHAAGTVKIRRGPGACFLRLAYNHR